MDEAGIVYLTRPLDRELQDAFEVHVFAVDYGDPPRTATATLEVLIYFT